MSSLHGPGQQLPPIHRHPIAITEPSGTVIWFYPPRRAWSRLADLADVAAGTPFDARSSRAISPLLAPEYAFRAYTITLYAILGSLFAASAEARTAALDDLLNEIAARNSDAGLDGPLLTLAAAAARTGDDERFRRCAQTWHGAHRSEFGPSRLAPYVDFDARTVSWLDRGAMLGLAEAFNDRTLFAGALSAATLSGRDEGMSPEEKLVHEFGCAVFGKAVETATSEVSHPIAGAVAGVAAEKVCVYLWEKFGDRPQNSLPGDLTVPVDDLVEPAADKIDAAAVIMFGDDEAEVFESPGTNTQGATVITFGDDEAEVFESSGTNAPDQQSGAAVIIFAGENSGTGDPTQDAPGTVDTTVDTTGGQEHSGDVDSDPDGHDPGDDMPDPDGPEEGMPDPDGPGGPGGPSGIASGLPESEARIASLAAPQLLIDARAALRTIDIATLNPNTVATKVIIDAGALGQVTILQRLTP